MKSQTILNLRFGAIDTVKWLLFVFLVCLGQAWSNIPVSASEPPSANDSAPLEFGLSSAILLVKGETLPLTFTNGPSRKSSALRELYIQRHFWTLTIRPTLEQQLWLQVPFHYNYAWVDQVGLTDAWTLGDARLIWVSQWNHSPIWKWKTLTGLILPSSTRGKNLFLLSDLDGMPNNRLIPLHQSPDGAEVVRGMVGIAPNGKIANRFMKPLFWNFQLDIRQPLGSGGNKPFTLIDFETVWRLPLTEILAFQAAFGQTRGWLPKGLFDTDIPTATSTQWSLLGAFDGRWGALLGLRWNPLADQEKEPYRLQLSSTQYVGVSWAVEPKYQIVTGFTYAWKPNTRRFETESHSYQDMDHDGIANSRDVCPNEAEDLDGYHDQDGCPDLDNDQDSVDDVHDLCPNEAEDMDGFNDQDGCPDLDNDHDGIPDLQDRCMNEPENFDGVEDEDGCPDRDSDHDGIEDSKDKCPTVKETFNFYHDKDGCPDEKPERVSHRDLEGIHFETGQSRLDSAGVLWVTELAEKMNLYKATVVVITGHADASESDPKALGLQRADAIVSELKRLGITQDRMQSLSKGSSEPIGNNQTAKGRSQNRRVGLEPR